MSRLLFAAIVALSLLAVAAPADACPGGKALRAVGKKILHPFNGRGLRRLRGC